MSKKEKKTLAEVALGPVPPPEADVPDAATDPLEAAAVPTPESIAPREGVEVAMARAVAETAERAEKRAVLTSELEAAENKRNAITAERMQIERRVLEAEEHERTTRLAWESAKRTLHKAQSEAGHEGPRRWKVLNPVRVSVQMAGGQIAWLSPGDNLQEDHYGGLSGIEALRESNPALRLELIGA